MDRTVILYVGAPHSGAVSGILARAAKALARQAKDALGAIARSWRMRATRATLAQLDAHSLRDLGINFSDVMVLTSYGAGAVSTTHRRIVHVRDPR